MADKKQAFLRVEAQRILKEAGDARGEEFAGLFSDFVRLFSRRFEIQAESWISFVDDNPQSFRKDGETDSIDAEVEFLIAETYLLGMTVQDTEIRAALAIGVDIDIRNEDAAAWAKKRAGELIRGADETTVKEIRAIIDDAVTNGRTVSEVKEAIMEKFFQYSEYRANLIAVMEMGTAFEQGKKEQFLRYAKHFGVSGYKRSFAHHDSVVRQSHLDNEKEGWIPAQNLFAGTHTDTAPHGFNCRCNVQWSLWNQDLEKPSFM